MNSKEIGNRLTQIVATATGVGAVSELTARASDMTEAEAMQFIHNFPKETAIYGGIIVGIIYVLKCIHRAGGNWMVNTHDRLANEVRENREAKKASRRQE